MIGFIIGNWKAIAVSILIAGAFFIGVEWSDRGWEAKIAKSERKAEASRVIKEKKAVEIFTKEAKLEKQIVYRTKIIYKDIARIDGDARCIDDPELRFAERWNKAASKTNTDSVQ